MTLGSSALPQIAHAIPSILPLHSVGSGSGKTSVSRRILASLPNVPWVAIVSQDSFYLPLTPEQVSSHVWPGAQHWDNRSSAWALHTALAHLLLHPFRRQIEQIGFQERVELRLSAIIR